MNRVEGNAMYIRNAPFVAVECKTIFENNGRTVLLEITDDLGAVIQVRVPECLMASVTGQFMRERLFGLH